jgi:NodT family efflux transporter outer membrane factor (OMF) lipoprotein
MFAKLWRVGLMAPLMVACAAAPPRAPDLATPAAFEAPRRGDSLPAAGLDQWWRLYRDPQLDALVAEALQGGFDARLARARLDEARALRAAANAQIYAPTGQVEASASHAKGDEDSYAASFSPAWELDLFGRRAASRQVATAELHSAEFTAEATRWVLVAQVADTLFAARGLAVQLAEAQETLRIQSALDASAKAKVDHGLAPASDAAQTQAAVGAIRAQIEDLSAQLDATRRALLALIGRGRAPLADLTIAAQVGAPPPPPATAPSDLLSRRPDVREAQWRLAAAAGRLQLAQLAFLPTLTLSPSYGVTKLTGSDATGIWSLGASAKVPVLDVPRLRQALRAQRAVSEQQVLAYERAVQTAYVEAETALASLDSDARRVALLRAAERDGAVGYEAKREGYQRGFNDLQNALAAESAWRQARVALAGAQVSALQRSVQVFKALGGGWSPPPDESPSPPVRRSAG